MTVEVSCVLPMTPGTRLVSEVPINITAAVTSAMPSP